jgi:hypothetical protein
MRCPKTPSPAETLRPGSWRLCRRVPPGATARLGLDSSFSTMRVAAVNSAAPGTGSPARRLKSLDGQGAARRSRQRRWLPRRSTRSVYTMAERSLPTYELLAHSSRSEA